MATENNNLSAREIVNLIKQRKLSPVDSVKAAIEATTQRNPSLNAIIFTDFDGALERARELEAKIMRGEPFGRMAGVPTLMKDLFDSRPGWPTTFGGIPALKDFMPDYSSTYPSRMEAQDAILIGKTNSPVLGFCGATDNPLFGATGNPFDVTRNSGGSSGGSAAAVADGIVTVAGATDGGGSIRIPASWSGTAGFQPSAGRVPMVMRPNAFGAAAPFLYEGAVARSVSDLALAMNVLAGYDALDPFSNTEVIDFDRALETSIKGKRIGFTVDFGAFPVDPQVAAVVSDAVRAFEEAGAIVELIDMKLPYDHKQLSDLWCRMISIANFSFAQGMKAMGTDLLGAHRDELPEQLAHFMELAGSMSLMELQADQIMRSAVFDAFTTAFMKYDFLVSPTTAGLPTKNRADGMTTGPEEINGVAVDPRIGWCMTHMTNMTGHPAASLPAGLADGLPVGLQIIGRHRADLDVMAACAAFEQARPWQAIYDIPAARSLTV